MSYKCIPCFRRRLSAALCSAAGCLHVLPFPLPAFSCFQVALLLLPTQMIRKLPDFIKHYGKTGELVAIRS